MSRISLIIALVVFSLRPSAVNCQNPIVANPVISVFAQSKISVLSHVSGSEQHIARRCSFINVENHDVLKTVSTHKLVYCLFNQTGFFSKTTVLFSAVPSVFSYGFTPLRI